MTQIGATSGGMPVSGLQLLDKTKLAVRKLTPEEIAQMQQLLQKPEPPAGKADNDPANIYATVKVGNKVVATLYNSGASVTPNAVYAQVGGLPSMGEGETLTGPALAQKRAEEIAQKLGGKIEKADTAQTQAQWRLSKAQPQSSQEYNAVAAALAANQDAVNAGARTKTTAQILGQQENDTGGLVPDAGDAYGNPVVQKFMEFAEKSTEEKMRAQILAALGLSEDDLKNMSPEDREKVEKKIAAMIKSEIQKEQEKQKERAAENMSANAKTAGANAGQTASAAAEQSLLRGAESGAQRGFRAELLAAADADGDGKVTRGELKAQLEKRNGAIRDSRKDREETA